MKKLLIGVGSVLGLVVVLVLAGPLLLPAGVIKERLTAAVLEATGRELRIAGALRLSLLPSPGVVVQDASFANAPGGVAPAMVRLKSLDVALRLWPLLSGRLEVARLVLTEPVIALEVDKDGRGNWVFTPARRDAAGGKSGGGGSADIALDDVRLVGGRLSYHDARTGVSHALEAIDIALSLPSLAGALVIDGGATWRGEPVKLRLAASTLGGLIKGGASGFELKLAAAPLTTTFTGTMTGLPPTRTEGVVDLATPSLRRLAAWAGSPIALKGDGLGPLSIRGRIAMAGAEMAFSDADIGLDTIRAKGALRVVTGGVRPALYGQLAVEKLDLNPYLPAETGPVPKATGKPATEPRAPAEWSDEPIDLAGLKAVDAELDLAAGGIQFRKILIDRARLAIRLKDGRLAADLAEMALYEGAGKGRFAVDGAAPLPGIDVAFALTGVQVDKLLSAAVGMERLAGVGSIDIAVAGSGKSQRALIAALDGKGAINLANGQIKGVNIAAMAKNALAGATGAGAGVAGSGADNRTDFGTLSATFRITDGILHNEDLKVIAPLTQLTGAGTVNLPARTLDYRVVVAIAGAVKLPVNIGGSWDHPTYQNDLADTLKGAIQNPGRALDQLKTLVPQGNPLQRLLPPR